jgi:hypothetical protein
VKLKASHERHCSLAKLCFPIVIVTLNQFLQPYLRATRNGLCGPLRFVAVLRRPDSTASKPQGTLDSCMTKNPVSLPPEVTLTTGEFDSRTIAPHTFPENKNGLVSTNIG